MLDLATKIVAVVLVVGAALHAYGSLLAFKPKTPERVWSLASAGVPTLLGVLAWLGVDRPDPALAAVAAVGLLGWAAAVVFYGRAIGNLMDPRVLYHLVAAIVLAVLVLV